MTDSSALKPESEPPPPDTNDGEKIGGLCKFCGQPALRRSRLRPADYARLVLVMMPLRCMNCRKRQLAFIPRAMRAVSSKAAHAGQLGSKETWQGFTSATLLERDQSQEKDLP